MSGPAQDASTIARLMQDDWNARAREDAHYYVAFGRRGQSAEEFFATAHEQAQGLLAELRRLPQRPARARRALEIGCGPGRLMLALAASFGEIHGVDISDEMIARARVNLARIPHAHPHHAPESDLRAFADDSFDFVYSYAVFQHIPSREVVFGYLREAWRVLMPSGILRCQLNGLPPTARTYDTWAGVRISAAEVSEFAARQGFLLLALEGAETQYLWSTLRKAPPWPADAPSSPVSIRRITNAWSSEPLVPVRGRFAALSLWVEGLPPDADLNSLSLTIAGTPAFLTYLGHPEPDGMRQLNAYLPAGLDTGLQPVRLTCSRGEASTAVRLIRPGPPVPRLLAVSDGIDLLSGPRITTGTVKLTVEEVSDPRALAITVNDRAAVDIDCFCTDPRLPRFEVNFSLPPGLAPGPAELVVRLGHRLLARAPLEVIPAASGPEPDRPGATRASG